MPKSAMHSKWTVVISSVISVTAIIIACALMVMYSNQRADDLEEDRKGRSLESCLNYNKDQVDTRAFEKAQLNLVINEVARDPNSTKMVALRAAHDALVEEKITDRDCSPEGIEAFFSGKDGKKE